MSTYHAVQYLHAVETTPRGSSHLIVTAILMILSKIVFAIIFGEVAVRTSEMNKKHVEFEDMLDNANSSMLHLGLPPNLQLSIRN
jgi:hypothetical protein